MRRSLFLIFFLIGYTYLSYGQDLSNNTVGIRVGDNKGFGIEVTYQHLLEENKRLEMGLGWHTGRYVNSYKLTALHQWVWVLEDKFNWYAGAGSGIGRLKFERYYESSRKTKQNTFIFIAGNIGVEYNLDNIPLLISLDFRPEIGFGQYRDDLTFDIALGLRYKF